MENYIFVFTDGSFHKMTGVGACFIPYGNQYFYLTSNVASSYEAQLLAVVSALWALPISKVHLFVDNPEVVKLLVDLGWEIDNKFGFIDWISRLSYKNSPIIKEIKLARRGRVTFVKSHTGILGNEIVDNFAKNRLGVALSKAEKNMKFEDEFPTLMK